MGKKKAGTYKGNCGLPVFWWKRCRKKGNPVQRPPVNAKTTKHRHGKRGGNTGIAAIPKRCSLRRGREAKVLNRLQKR